MEIGKHYKSGLFPLERQLLNTDQHIAVPTCVSAIFPTLLIVHSVLFLPENEGVRKMILMLL